MPRNSLRFPLGLRNLLWVALGGLFVTGVFWLVLHYSANLENDSDTTHLPLEPWLLRIHGLAAYVTRLVLGAVYVRHVRPAWRAKRNRTSGTLLTGILALLILSGCGLYYFGGESLRQWTAYLHDFLGLVLPILLLFHILRGRAQRPKVVSGPPK